MWVPHINKHTHTHVTGFDACPLIAQCVRHDDPTKVMNIVHLFEEPATMSEKGLRAEKEGRKLCDEDRIR